MNDSMTLAKAMGWPENGPLYGKTIRHNNGYPEKDGPWADIPAFLPDRNTSDDYLVLEWVRNMAGRYEPEHQEWPEGTWEFFVGCLCSRGLYDIGDYGRAALRVLKRLALVQTRQSDE